LDILDRATDGNTTVNCHQKDEVSQVNQVHGNQ